MCLTVRGRCILFPARGDCTRDRIIMAKLKPKPTRSVYQTLYESHYNNISFDGSTTRPRVAEVDHDEHFYVTQARLYGC